MEDFCLFACFFVCLKSSTWGCMDYKLTYWLQSQKYKNKTHSFDYITEWSAGLAFICSKYSKRICFWCNYEMINIMQDFFVSLLFVRGNLICPLTVTSCVHIFGFNGGCKTRSAYGKILRTLKKKIDQAWEQVKQTCRKLVEKRLKASNL